jgi:hypothetical protein
MDIPLLENGSSIVNAAFLSSQKPSPPSNAEVANGDADIVGVIDKIAAEFIKLTGQKIDNRPATDARMAEFLHRELKLTLYQAAQRKFWHYIAVVKCPQYVAWRWFDDKKNSVPKAHYTGPWHRNAFGRLWWWAEYTRDSEAGKDQYARTVRAGRSQEFMKNTIENSLCGNRALVRSLCDAAFPASGIHMKDEQHRALVVRANAMLVTTALDALQPSEIDEVVKSLVREMNISGEPEATRKTPRSKGFLNRLVGRK